MAKVLVTGGSGYLGSLLLRLLSKQHRVYGTYRTTVPSGYSEDQSGRIDIAERESLRRVFGAFGPELVVHTAALTKPDYCEAHREETDRVNVEGTRNVAAECRRIGARLIHISTDLVFDGQRGLYTEADAVRAVNHYALSKIRAEEVVTQELSSAVILRVSVMYGPANSIRPGFVDEVLGRWRKGESMSFFVDQYRTPTFAPQIAETIQRVMERPEVDGLFHLGGAERLSRFDFAKVLARVVGAPESLILPSSMHDRPGAAPRPADCSLVSKKIEQVLGLKPKSCLEALEELSSADLLYGILDRFSLRPEVG